MSRTNPFVVDDNREDAVMLKNMPKELPGNALDDDALDRVAGGAGANSGRVEADGTVIEIQPNGK